MYFKSHEPLSSVHIHQLAIAWVSTGVETPWALMPRPLNQNILSELSELDDIIIQSCTVHKISSKQSAKHTHYMPTEYNMRDKCAQLHEAHDPIG